MNGLNSNMRLYDISFKSYRIAVTKFIRGTRDQTINGYINTTNCSFPSINLYQMKRENNTYQLFNVVV